MKICGYEIGQVFHIGSNGPLWRTRTEAGDALVALRSPRDGEQNLARWKAWASISSRHVVALRDVVRSDDGRWAIIEDYVRGRTLDSELGSADLRPIATRRQIVHGIAAGVSALHAAGIVHGDLTPTNIIITPEGRAVIIDLIDEISDGEGTPGWSLETSGKAGDQQCLRRIAALLSMEEELDHLGFDSASSGQSGATPTVAEADEHVILREPVDPERVIAQLRAAALREETVTDHDNDDSSPGAGHRSKAPRIRRWGRVSILAGGLVVIITGLAIMAYGTWRGTSQGRDSAPGTQSSGARSASPAASSMCEPTVLTDLISRAIATRDRAVVDGDASALQSVLGGELLEQDTSRIDTMRSQGVRVAALSSTIDNVAVLSCEQGAIDVGATLTVQSSQVCRADECENRDIPEVTDLVIRVDPVSRKVVKAEPVAPDDGQSTTGTGSAG